MTTTEIKRTLLAEHDRQGFFPAEVVQSIMKEARQPGVSMIEVICCMLELVYTDKNREN